MQRVADQAQAAKTEASDALAKETSLRSKLDLLCKELQKRNLEMKLQLAKQQEEQLKSHQGAPLHKRLRAFNLQRRVCFCFQF